MLQDVKENFIQTVIDEYSNAVYKLCIIYLKNYHDAEDAVQEVFIKIIEKAPSFSSDGHKKAWIIKVTINHCKNILKRKKHETMLDDNLASYVEKFDNKEILQSIFDLPLNYRNVVYLYYYEGYSTKEISYILKKRDATIRTWLKRARDSLKEVIGGAYDEKNL